jgi:hypothetical protein
MMSFFFLYFLSYLLGNRFLRVCGQQQRRSNFIQIFFFFKVESRLYYEMMWKRKSELYQITSLLYKWRLHKTQLPLKKKKLKLKLKKDEKNRF